MTTNEIKKLLENLANPYIEHEQVEKCGLCLKNKIHSEVANEFLQAGKLSAENLTEMFAEVDRRWKETELYQRVRGMLSQGKTLEQISEELSKEGIDI
jgi:hypothetical protein